MNKQQQIDAKECEEAAEKGLDKDCGTLGSDGLLQNRKRRIGHANKLSVLWGRI